MSAFFLDDSVAGPVFLPFVLTGDVVVAGFDVAEEGATLFALSGAVVFGLAMLASVVVHLGSAMSWGGLIAARAGRAALGSSTTMVGVDGAQLIGKGLAVAALRAMGAEHQTEQLRVSSDSFCQYSYPLD